MSIESQIQEAINHLNTGNMQSAADLLQDVLGKDPGNENALISMMHICMSINDHQNGKVFIDRLKHFHPNNPVAYNSMGMIYFKQNELLDAEREFLHAINLDPLNAEPYFNLSHTYIKLGKLDDAVFYLIRNISHNPFDYASKNLLIKLYNAIYKNRYPSFERRNEFSVIISFSSLDESFIDTCIDNVAGVAKEVIIIGFSKLFEGQEDLPGMQAIIERNKHKNVRFIVKDLPPKTFESNVVYNNIIRVFGFDYVKETAPYVLFIDGDEVAEKTLLTQWKESFTGEVITTRFYNYWYFRQPIYQSEQLEYSPVLFDTNFLRFLLDHNYEDIYKQPFDRNFYEFTADRVMPVIFHHYSWVRTKQQMLDKVKNWGHKNDRNWTELVEEEFMHGFTGKDFVHGYSYKTVENIFKIQLPE